VAGKIEDLRETDWLTEGEAYVRKNPVQAVLIALGVGIVVGINLRKR